MNTTGVNWQSQEHAKQSSLATSWWSWGVRTVSLTQTEWHTVGNKAKSLKSQHRGPDQSPPLARTEFRRIFVQPAWQQSL